MQCQMVLGPLCAILTPALLRPPHLMLGLALSQRLGKVVSGNSWLGSYGGPSTTLPWSPATCPLKQHGGQPVSRGWGRGQDSESCQTSLKLFSMTSGGGRGHPVLTQIQK